MKKLLAVALVLVLCLSVVLVACDKPGGGGTTESNNPVAKLDAAADAVYKLYKDRITAETTSSFNLSKAVPLEGIYSFPIEWTVNTDKIQVVDAGNGIEVTIKIPEKPKEDIAYTLTATVKADNGTTKAVTFERKVPKYSLLTYAEYIAAEKDASVTVRGTVSAISSKSAGNKYNKLYMYDADGGYNIYSMKEDPKTLGIKLGMIVEVTGIKDIYNGTHEVKDATAKIINNTENVVFEDITTIFNEATDLKDAKLAAKLHALVAIKNVTIGDIDKDNGYYKFSAGGKTTYLRISSSECMLNTEEQTKFATDFAAAKGKLADVKGVVMLFNGEFYLAPVTTDAFVEKVAEVKTPAEQIADVKSRMTIDMNISGSGRTFTLPTTDSLYPDVKIAWTAADTAIAKIEGGKVTYTFAEDGTVKLTATLTHATDATVSDTKEFTVNLSTGTPTTIKEFYKLATGSDVYIVTGYVVASAGTHDKAGSFVIADETGSIFSYKKAKVEVGDYVQVIGTRDESFSLAQLGTLSVKQLTGGAFVEATPQDINVADVKVDGSTYYLNQFYKIVGGKLAVETSNGKTYYNLYDGTTKMVALYGSEALETEMKALDGKEVVVYGYSRGVNTSLKYWQVQVTRLNERTYTDAELLAKDAAALTIKDSYFADFELPLAGANGSTITWAPKEATSVISIDPSNGKVTINPVDPSTAITLVATLSKGEAEHVTKEFPITILKETPQFTVNYTVGENGTITVKAGETVVATGTKVDVNTKLTVTVAPAEGFRLASVTIGEGAADTSFAGKTSFELTITADTTFAVAFETIPAGPVVVASLTFPDSNKDNNAIGSYTTTWTAKNANNVAWTITNFNNNKWGNNWTFIKCGSKKAASVASIATDAAFTDAIAKITIDFDKVSSVNSAKIIVASDAAFSKDLQEIDFTSALKAGKVDVSITTPTANCFYKIVFDCALASGNGPVVIKSVDYIA